MAGLCCDCIYFEKSGGALDTLRNTFGGLNGCNDIGYCRVLTDAYGNSKKVKGLDTCNHFVERPTASNSGYNSSGGCFLTSACVEYMGKADDCKELTVLRQFRDGYMKSTEEGSRLVEEYYKIAPDIVAKVNADTQKNDYYEYIYSVVTKCVDLIENNKMEEALASYKTMVETLQSKLI